jgi:hypothetical protein
MSPSAIGGILMSLYCISVVSYSVVSFVVLFGCLPRDTLWL